METQLTARNQQVVDLLLQGYSNKEIGAELGISPRTVKQHLCFISTRNGIGRGRVQIAAHFGSKETSKIERVRFTAQQRTIAALVAEGKTNKFIANFLGTTEQTVKNYVRTLFNKCGVWSRLQLSIWWMRHGSIPKSENQ